MTNDKHPVLDSRNLSFFTSEDDVGIRVDKILARLPEIRTRSRAAKLIEDQKVRHNGKPVKPSYLVEKNDVFEIEIPGDHSNRLVPLEMNLHVVFEDDHLLVVEKPAGLVVHPAAGHAQDTLVNALIKEGRKLSMGFSEQRPGIVHRLDKDTSGLLVVAKTDVAHERLAQQFKQRSVFRIYWAITYGTMKEVEGTMESFIGRHPTDRKRFSSQKMGKIAITHFERVASFHSDFSLFRIKLETGRTHQIRVHFSEKGLPVVGDKIYLKKQRHIECASMRPFVSTLDRIALHAAELAFTHPHTNERLHFRSKWPEDLEPLVKFCRWETIASETSSRFKDVGTKGSSDE